MSVPEKFFGRYQLDKSENFDEFLSSKGVNWFVRQMIKLAGLTKIISQNQEAGKYNMENLTSKKNTNYQGWELGKTFEAPGLDGNQHQITFDFKDEILSEHHIRLNEPETSAETYFYTIDDQNQLVMRMENNGIVCRRWFKKVEQK
ncbi:CBN-LBP-4 protein [Caenorhabditis brenneri]|uniref:CBN-LBP-4 protein n=1 Tax=Caenorhabditis brenneri TaxID=135651 RepID=G0MTN3_CAEBE|nr:CBN-LBP-4 protein [Caenorhabditis brenneri]